MVDQKVTHKPSIFHALGLHPARNMHQVKPPQLLLMTQQQREAFRRSNDTFTMHASHLQKNDTAAKKGTQETPLTALLSQKKGVFQHLNEQDNSKKTPTDSPKSSKNSSGTTTPSESGDLTCTTLLKLPPEELLKISPEKLFLALNKRSPIPSVSSEASLNSFVLVDPSSKASSSYGDYCEVSSVPDSELGSPELRSLPKSLLHSHLRLPQAALEPKPGHSVHEDSDSDDETVEQSTATLKA